MITPRLIGFHASLPKGHQYRWFHFKETLSPCRSCLVSCSIHTHRPQRCIGSASAAGSRLVSSHLCTPGSRESASDKTPRGVSCLVSCPDEFPQRITSFAHAIASHRDTAPENTPGCSHTTDAEPLFYASSYTAHDGTLSADFPLSDQV